MPHRLGGGNSVSQFRKEKGKHFGKGDKVKTVAAFARMMVGGREAVVLWA